MSAARVTRQLIESMAKHLPPSAATLRLLDVDGVAGETLGAQRADLDVIAVSGAPDAWDQHPASADAITALVDDAHSPSAAWLAAAYPLLRPGGRLIVVQAQGVVDDVAVKRLENAGYVRILAETAVEYPLPVGVLLRGERVHSTADTLARVQVTASQDDDALDLAAYSGRYLHLLVIQTPNKPVWALRPDESVHWQAVTAGGALLAFSSLPKAVGFMQQAVLDGTLHGVNKVPKFSKATAAAWPQPVRLNPTPDVLRGQPSGRIAIDPASAEAPDE
jgi:hypothetical protein